MELFDELTEDGEYTGNVVDRELAHKNGAWHKAVVLFIVNSKRQIFMQRRSPLKRVWPNCWDFAAGGHVDSGEFGIDAVIRECAEEIDVEINENDVRYVSTSRSENKIGDVFNRHYNELYVVYKDVDITKLKLQKEEVSEVKWIDFEEFENLVKTRDKTLTEKWVTHETFIKFFLKK